MDAVCFQNGGPRLLYRAQSYHGGHQATIPGRTAAESNPTTSVPSLHHKITIRIVFVFTSGDILVFS